MAYRDKYSIRRGKITLYRRDSEGAEKTASDTWYGAFKIPGMRSVRRSLKTEYQDEAEAIAEDMFQELLHKQKKGLSLSTKRFSHIANDYLKHFEKKVELHKSLSEGEKYKLRKYSPNAYQRKLPIIQNQLIPFFGEKIVTEITQHDVDEFKTARQFYWLNGTGKDMEAITYKRGKHLVTRKKLPSEKTIISHNTVNKELTVLREIFNYAKEKRILAIDEIPHIENVIKPKGYDEEHSTPELTEEELDKLLNTIGKKHYYQTNPKHKLAHKRLGMYIAIMATTGMRVTEAKKLTFKDCRTIKNNGNTYLAIHVWGKGKQRETIPLQACEAFIDQMRKHHIKNSKNFDWEFSEDMPVFMNEYGKPVGSFSNALNSTLKEAGLLYSAEGKKRCAMSFRPTFITLALAKGEMSNMQLAVNLGTSVEVIEKHYNQMKSKHIPAKLQFDTSFNKYLNEPE